MFKIDLHIPLWVWIVSQVIGLCTLTLFVIAYQQKKKSKQLGIMCGGNLSEIIAAILLLNWVSVGIEVVALFKNGAFSIIQRDRKRVNRALMLGLLLFFCACNITIMILLFLFIVPWFWFNWVLLAAILFANYAKYSKSIHTLKIAGVLVNVCLIVNKIVFLDVMGLVRHCFIIGSVTVFYIRAGIEKRKRFP